MLLLQRDKFSAGKAFARLKPKTSRSAVQERKEEQEKKGWTTHKKWHNLLKKVFQFINDKQNDKKERGIMSATCRALSKGFFSLLLPLYISPKEVEFF